MGWELEFEKECPSLAIVYANTLVLDHLVNARFGGITIDLQVSDSLIECTSNMASHTKTRRFQMSLHAKIIGRRGLLAVTSILFLFLAGCSSIRVDTDYDKQTSFTQLKTYDWIERPSEQTENPSINSPLVEKRIRNAIDNELSLRGFQKQSGSAPDFLVAIHVVTDEKIDITTIDHHYGYASLGYRRFGYGWYGHRHYGHYSSYGYGPYGGTTQIVNEYLKGTLIIDIVDPKENELIWRGWASRALDDDPRPEMVQMYVAAAVQKILKKFPPSA